LNQEFRIRKSHSTLETNLEEKSMKKFSALLGAFFLLLGLMGPCGAQSKTFTRDSATIAATVEAINQTERTLTVKGPNGNYVDLVASSDVKRFSEIKVGDKINIRYYDTVVMRLKPSGEKSVDTASEATTPGIGAKPAGTVAKQRTITATITQLDPKVPSITFTGPNNWQYSSRIYDKKVLKTIKVGDRVDITWTEAVLLSLETPAPATK
jgi:hypothetical protein